MEHGAEPTVAPGEPTPEQVLGWIGASPGVPWFPARHAERTGTSRDALDLPLNQLRSTELVRVVDWVRGLGQGYALTADGELTLAGRKPDPAPLPPVEIEPDEPRIAKSLITPVLVALNLLVYFIGAIVAMRLGVGLDTYLWEGDGPTSMRLGAVTSLSLLAGEWWRLAASCFVHGTAVHLVVNMISLAMIGAVAEHIWGRWRMLVIYLVSGFGGSCLAMAIRPLEGNVPVPLVGASGAIWGIFTSIMAWMLLNHRYLHPQAVVEVTRRLGYGFVLGVAVSLLPRVSWEGHLGGAVAGFLVAMLLHLAFTCRGWRQVAAIVLAAAMPAACLGGLILATRYSSAWARLHLPPRPAYLLDPIPHLNAIRPEAMKLAINDVNGLLALSPAKRTPERVKSVRENVASLWSNAVEASKRLDLSSGIADEANRAKARAFADARVQSLGRLLAMIDANTIPTVESWKEWGQLDREADRLWNELAKKE